MKTQTFTFHVGKEQIRKLEDPNRKKHDSYFALVRVKDLPMDLPLDVNPRNQDTGSRVSRQIEQSLLNNPETFHLLNRGMTVIAKGIDYDNKSETLKLNIPMGSNDYGVLDGGHTYQVIRKNVIASQDEEAKTSFIDGFVRIEIMQGLPDELIVDIARARNTSAQVKGFSLANLENKFDPLKEALKDQPFANKIAYKENEDDTDKPIDILEIVAFATMYHPTFEDSDNPPVLSYSSKSRCLDMFAAESNQPGYTSVQPILADIVKLYDHIHFSFESLYEEIGGFSGLIDDGKSRKGVKLGLVREVKQYEKGFDLYYMGKKAQYRFPDGWLYPVVASLRGLVNYKPKNTTWKTDPFEFFNKHGKKLVQHTLEAGKTLGRNPNAIGKNKAHWTQLHDKVSLIVARAGL